MDNSLKILFLLNMADISLTKYLTNLGAQELNPIIAYLLSINFLWALLFKVIAVGVFIYIAASLIGQIKSMRRMVTAANVFFVLLVLYQLVGVVVLTKI